VTSEEGQQAALVGMALQAEAFEKKDRLMFEVSVDEQFAAAHNLRNYKGKCENLHGHNYKVRITLAGPQLDEVGLLYDFVHLKQVIQGVIRALDHKYLNELKPFDVLNPSAENIAKHIYDETSKQMHQTPNGAGISSITVWESDVTAATYRP
jgi:6-pyruvoyltetrahydropterin/6-carboxytetrahydropterin synthase